jgi:hypothetical protein
MANFKLLLSSWLNRGNKGLPLPLAMTEVLSWNQMDHDKNFLCESHLYVCDSATPSLYTFFFERGLTYASTFKDPPEGVPPL